MSFFEKVIGRGQLVWDECANTAFVRELYSGCLSDERFRKYLIEDSIYLTDFARVIGGAIHHAGSLDDIQMYYSVLSFVSGTECESRRAYLAQFGLTDNDVGRMEAAEESRRYSDFLKQIVRGGDEREILMAVLPCVLSYSYIFRRIVKIPGYETSKYRKFIEEYASDAYAENCRCWQEYAERKCSDLTTEEKEKLGGIFESSCRMELAFWQMVYDV